MNKKLSPEIDELINEKADVLYEDAPCGFIFTDPDGYILRVNHTFAEWMGYKKQDLVHTKRFQDLFSVGSKIYYETNFGPLLRMQGFLNEVALELMTESQKKIHVLVNSLEVRDESGNPILIKSSIFNITDRKKYERELLSARVSAEQGSRRLDLLVRIGEKLRSSGDYVSCLEAVTDISSEEFVDACAIDLVDGSKLLRLVQSTHFPQRAVPVFNGIGPTAFNEPIFIADTEVLHDNHKILAPMFDSMNAQSVIIVPIHRRDQQFGVASFFLTELGRKFSDEDFKFCQELAHRLGSAIENIELQQEKDKTHLELKDSHKWFSTTLKSIGDAVIVINSDRRIDFLNPAAEELTKWNLEDAVGLPMTEVFNVINSVTGERAHSPVEIALTEGTTQTLANNTALIRKDASQIVIEDSASPIRGDRGEILGVVLVFRDVTEQHKVEIAKNSLLKNLHSEKEIREKFVATLTHDLRSPLTAVKLNIQMMQRKLNDPVNLAALSTRAIKNINRVDRMIQDLLDANRMRAGEIILMEMDRFNFVDLLNESISDLTMVHGDRFYLDTPAALHGFWNKDGMRRIIENLCNNAVKYGAYDLPIMVTLKHEGEFAVLSVHNEGNPISEEELPFLFEPYKRSDSAVAGIQKGWGLGLTLVKGVTEGHQGKIKVTSSKNAGTTFEIQLPIDAKKYL